MTTELDNAKPFFSVYYFCWRNFGVGHSWRKNSCYSPFSLFLPLAFPQLSCWFVGKISLIVTHH